MAGHFEGHLSGSVRIGLSSRFSTQIDDPDDFFILCQGGALLHPPSPSRLPPSPLLVGARALHLELLRGQRHLVHPRESYNFVIDL